MVTHTRGVIGKNHSMPKLADGLKGKTATDVACGGYHTILCAVDGEIYSFGRGALGQVGHGNFDNKFTPTIIKQVQLEGKCVVKVACGWYHSMALTTDTPGGMEILESSAMALH